jgi:hypothetical protein
MMLSLCHRQDSWLSDAVEAKQQKVRQRRYEYDPKTGYARHVEEEVAL